jgi:hypothetical protein
MTLIGGLKSSRRRYSLIVTEEKRARERGVLRGRG